MCADGAKVPAQRFSYSNALDGIIRIAREEGVVAFSKGLGPNIARSVLMSQSNLFHHARFLCSLYKDVSQIAV